ncbi:MAG: 30S ribosomal protein S16 [Patescibacteria group bacterium]|nr:30S ribosomal protein S16 [Patescibacteria group bacterium]MCX7589516.1 30S ribosomal protein S16 [Patescibacteria group bacterium]MDW8279938.1 30S ribosomal protein S16 [bacterium]
MLAIRFKKVGRKHQISFRIVVAEKRSKRDGKNVEDIGFYNPTSKEFGIKKERLDYWLKNGAKPTPTVHNLLIKKQLISGKKIRIKTKTKNNNQNQAQVDNSSNQENQSIENSNNQINQEPNTENNA